MDAKKELECQLEEARKQKNELTQKLTNLQKEKEATADGRHAGFEDYKNSIQEFKNNLDEQGKAVLSTRAALEKKIKNCKSKGIALFILYALIAFGVFYLLKIELSLVSIVSYSITALVGIITCVIVVNTLRKPFKQQLEKTYSDPCIIEFDKKLKQMHEDFRKKYNDNFSRERALEKEAEALKTEINKITRTENSLLYEIEEFDFNFAYKDTILFYGKDKGNYYSIYLDGRIYDTVRGRQIVKIMLSPGIHSFWVENTCYNIDRSVIYNYVFNTQQVVAGEKPEAFAVVCEYNQIERVSGQEFQKITKTILI